jgi:hypothetical protein
VKTIILAAALMTLMGAAQNSFAAVPATPSPTPFETKFSGKWITRYSTSPQQAGDENKKSSVISVVQVALRTSPEFWIQGGIGFNQIIDPAQKFNLVNPDFRGFYRVTDATSKKFKIEIGPTTSFALSEDSRNESLYFTLGAAARFTFSLQKPEVGGFITYYDVAFNRNIHQYETSSLAEVNTQYSIDHYLYFEYDFEGPFLIDVWGGFSSAWSYQNVVKNAFTVGEEIAYSISDSFDIAISHERGGDFLSPSGQTYNFGLFDSGESRYSISATVYF